MLIKPRVASIFIWKHTEALFRGLFSGVMVVEEWDLSPLGAPLVMKGISRTIREKREVLVRMSKSELLNHHQVFVVSLKNAFAMVLKLQHVDTESIALLCTVSSTLRVGTDVCIPHFCRCGERIYSEGFHGLLTQCWPLSNAFDNN